MKLTPHQKIMRAYRRGTGARLTVEDVIALGMDDAICYRAECDDQTPDERASDRHAEDVVARRVPPAASPPSRNGESPCRSR